MSTRPMFRDVDEMNDTIDRNLRERLTSKDDLYILGDVGMGKPEAVIEWLESLPFRLHLIHGNHDHRKLRAWSGWRTSVPFLELKTNHRKIVLCHFAMRTWNRSHYGVTMLHGHSHGSLPGNSQSLDVGVDCWDFKPVTLEEIDARLATLPPFKQEDHHVASSLDGV